MSEINSEATQTDESQVSDFDFDAMADDVLGLEPETATQDGEEDTEELEGVDPRTEEDAEEVDEVNEGEEEEEVEDEDDDDESATQEDDTDELDDSEIDMDFTVPVKIDGETSEVTMEELIANYQTKQHQSKKGDEIAKQTKELAQAKEESMMYANINAQLLGNEDEKDLNILKGLQEKVDKAYEEDDYEAGKLNRQFEKAKEEYSKRKANRDSIMQTMGQKMQGQQVEAFNQQVESFKTEIPNLVPDWSEDVALKNREFALSLGLGEQLVDSIVDPIVVSVIDGYRRLKESTSKGAVKRKKVAVKRVPTKKPVSKNTKKSNRIDQSRQRINKGRGTENDDKVVFDNVIDSMFE
jgi:hypothetical protein